MCRRAKSFQTCPTLCDPMDCSPPDSSVHGIFPKRILEWVAVASSKASSRLRDWTHVSYIAGGHVTADPPGTPLKTVSHRRNLYKFQRILIIQTVLFDDKAVKLEMYNKSSFVFFFLISRRAKVCETLMDGNNNFIFFKKLWWPLKNGNTILCLPN